MPLTGADIRRLKQAGYHEEDFVEFLSQSEVNMTGEPESFARLKPGRRLLALRHVGDDDSDESGRRCVFLDSSGCRAHPARPSACRTYPFDRPEGREALGLVPSYMCPDKTGVLVTLRGSRDSDSVRPVTLALRYRDQEMSDHAEQLQLFNRLQGTRLRLRKVPQTGRQLLDQLLFDSATDKNCPAEGRDS